MPPRIHPRPVREPGRNYEKKPPVAWHPLLNQIFHQQDALQFSNRKLAKISGQDNTHIGHLRSGYYGSTSLHVADNLATSVGLDLLLLPTTLVTELKARFPDQPLDQIITTLLKGTSDASEK